MFLAQGKCPGYVDEAVKEGFIGSYFQSSSDDFLGVVESIGPGGLGSMQKMLGVTVGSLYNTRMSTPAENVLGHPLESCCTDPMTGWKRTGSCETDAYDHGAHVICVRVTSAFLEFSKLQGNDLSTPRPEFNFPGLKDGDCWCLCALRWKEALEAGVAPRVKLQSTHRRALDYVSLADLARCALDD